MAVWEMLPAEARGPSSFVHCVLLILLCLEGLLARKYFMAVLNKDGSYISFFSSNFIQMIRSFVPCDTSCIRSKSDKRVTGN